MTQTLTESIRAESCGLLNGGIKMKHNYGAFFGFEKSPFSTDIKASEILKTPELIDVEERFGYVVGLGAIGLITGEVGSGKTTALRYALEKLHPSGFSPKK